MLDFNTSVPSALVQSAARPFLERAAVMATCSRRFLSPRLVVSLYNMRNKVITTAEGNRSVCMKPDLLMSTEGRGQTAVVTSRAFTRFEMFPNTRAS